MSDGMEMWEDELLWIRFTIPGAPFGKQRPRVSLRKGANGRTFSKAYTPDKTVSYENLVKWCYTQSSQNSQFRDNCPLEVKIDAYYEIPQSVSKKKREEMLIGKITPTKKPDWDNIGKIVCDSLNGIAYHDDSSIVKATVIKRYSETPHVTVYIKKIEYEE